MTAALSPPTHGGPPPSPAPVRAALRSAAYLLFALLLAAAATVTIWYWVGDGSGFKGKLAVRAGGDSLGLPTLGQEGEIWTFRDTLRFVAPDNPADDDRLRDWLAAQPEVREPEVRRRSEDRFRNFGYDAEVSVAYDRFRTFGNTGPIW